MRERVIFFRFIAVLLPWAAKGTLFGLDVDDASEAVGSSHGYVRSISFERRRAEQYCLRQGGREREESL